MRAAGLAVLAVLAGCGGAPDGGALPEYVMLDIPASAPAFAIGRTEVTQELWRSVTGEAPSHYSDCGLDCPVEQVSWTEAARFANALNERMGLTPCYTITGGAVRWPEGLACEGYRLPTEHEWALAARAGQTYRFAGSDDADAVGWTRENSDNRTHEVGQKAPNAWGLYDMTGNVFEWCWGWYEVAPPGAGQLGPEEGTFKVSRGGASHYRARYAELALRQRDTPETRRNNLGLRLVRSR